MARGGRVSWHGEGWWSAREGVVGIHPGRSSFLQYVRVRAVRTIDEVLEKPQLGLRTRAEDAASARARAVLLREVFNE